jgi:hypothetical protein
MESEENRNVKIIVNISRNSAISTYMKLNSPVFVRKIIDGMKKKRVETVKKEAIKEYRSFFVVIFLFTIDSLYVQLGISKDLMMPVLN